MASNPKDEIKEGLRVRIFDVFKRKEDQNQDFFSREISMFTEIKPGNIHRTSLESY
jgi:hypothetical protein